MPSLLRVRFDADGNTHTAEATGPLELGRQLADEPDDKVFQVLPAARGRHERLLVAPAQERDNFSRSHLLLEALPGEQVRVTNLSKAPLPPGWSHASPLQSGEQVILPAPFAFRLFTRTFNVEVVTGLESLDQETIAPGSFGQLAERAGSVAPPAPGQLEGLIGWLQTTMGVLQSAVGSLDFLERAARALVEIVGLHSGRVILRDGDGWKEAAVCAVHGRAGPWEPSRHVLTRMVKERKTFWQQPGSASPTESLRRVQSVVAAPVRNKAGDVTGALYGERYLEGDNKTRPVGKIEAMLAELLACGVAAGLARQEQERWRERFRQFFTEDLARQLELEPDLLKGREAEVSLLFCDVRGFSRVSEKLGPIGTVEWISDVMGELSRCVLAEGGVLVDYVGDELLAMWGAPVPQPDHPLRAVQAALAMRDALPRLNERWLERLEMPTNLGIGVNTGAAHVGNTGSEFKFKYGPLGHSVNVASRAQGLTKYLKCRVAVTRATWERVRDLSDFIARRIVKTRMVNIEQPVDLFEVERAGPPERRAFFEQSEAALQTLEERDFSGAVRMSATLLDGHTGDGPLRLTLARASEMLVDESRPFDPVWTPPGK
jgi:adenylate cyclase